MPGSPEQKRAFAAGRRKPPRLHCCCRKPTSTPKATRAGSPRGEPTPPAALCAAVLSLLPRSAALRGRGCHPALAPHSRGPGTSPCPHSPAGPTALPPLPSPPLLSLTPRRGGCRSPGPAGTPATPRGAKPPRDGGAAPLSGRPPAGLPPQTPRAAHLQRGRRGLPGAQRRAARGAADLPAGLETPFAQAGR